MKKFIWSFRYAVRGWGFVWRDEPNFRFQMIVAFAAICLGFYFDITALEWVALLFCIMLVLCLEMVNTAIESLVDLVTLDRLPLAGKIKDVAAGSVLLASVVAVIIGGIIFWPYVFPPH